MTVIGPLGSVLLAASLAALLPTAVAPARTGDAVRVRVDASQAEAVLHLVEKRRSGEPITHADWQDLFATEPYRRLRQRETEMGRPFTDSAFMRFVLSDEVDARAGALRETLDRWRTRDLEASARRVLAYLPPEANINATVYPVIKPQTNSFVYDVRGDPAVFLYLDPEVSAERFENTVAHEMHHVGFATVAPGPGAATADAPDAVRTAIGWLGAFGEGFAMLAAAGDPNVHPHAVGTAAERARWDRDMAEFDRDLERLESFFLDVVGGRLSGDDVRSAAMAFFGEQGPWYTVGYGMAIEVERRYGRAVLIECILDPRLLLVRYNAAVAEAADGRSDRAPWSPELLRALGV